MLTPTTHACALILLGLFGLAESAFALVTIAHSPTNFKSRVAFEHPLLAQKDEWPSQSMSPHQENGVVPSLAINLAGLTVLIGSILVHSSGWSHFWTSLVEMKNNATTEEFSSALQFWLFAALSHPILKPIFVISEWLHASPGPKVADLVPVSFVLGTGAVTYALLSNENLRKAAGVVALAWLLNYVGAGLDGQKPLGDYNIQLDDDYQGKIVKGCPPAETITIKDEFDYNRYQGRWYWQEVHDWTQFREMYDTTLDIRLTDNGYVNTLTIKGPSPTNSPRSWDKSPLLNGVRYSWTGTIDEATNGVSKESGFGVSFPNYIVDVEKDDAGRYQQLIQFQCIEVGGVRLYEGIDFMSRNPDATEEELREMHRRARRAGLNPYGATPEQMHRIERRPTAANESNEWQKLWVRLRVDRYLDQSLK